MRFLWWHQPISSGLTSLCPSLSPYCWASCLRTQMGSTALWSPHQPSQTWIPPTPFFLLTPTHSLALLWIDVALWEAGLLLTQRPPHPAVGRPPAPALPTSHSAPSSLSGTRVLLFVLFYFASRPLFTFTGLIHIWQSDSFLPSPIPMRNIPFYNLLPWNQTHFTSEVLEVRWASSPIFDFTHPPPAFFFRVLHLFFFNWNTVDLWGFPGGSDGKESASNAGGLGSILGMRSSPGGGYGNPLQYSCLENCYGHGGAWRATKGWTWDRKGLDMTEWLRTAQQQVEQWYCCSAGDTRGVGFISGWEDPPE